MFTIVTESNDLQWRTKLFLKWLPWHDVRPSPL